MIDRRTTPDFTLPGALAGMVLVGVWGGVMVWGWSFVGGLG